MEFYIRCLDPFYEGSKNTFIHDAISRHMDKNKIESSGVSYTVTTLPAKWVEHILYDDNNVDASGYILNQLIDLIMKNCFEAHVTLDDVYAKK